MTDLEIDDIYLSSTNIHYFASLCLPEIYKQQTHLFDTYISQENAFSIVSRGCGNTTAQAIYALWYMAFNPRRTIGYTNVNNVSCEGFINEIIKINNRLPDYIKIKFTTNNRYTLVSENGSRIIAKVCRACAFRGTTINTFIFDSFHFLKQKDLSDILTVLQPTLVCSNAKIILSTTINPNGFKLYEFINHFILDRNFWISAIPYKKCSNYSFELDERLKKYSSSEFYLSEYCCIDREGISYVE